MSEEGHEITKKERSIINNLVNFAISRCPGRRKHFACGASGKAILFAENRYEEISNRTIGKYYKYPSPHAEFELVRRFGSFKKVYIVRMNRSFGLINSEPCDSCKRFLKDSGVRFVLFSDSFGAIKKLKLR